MKNNNGEAKTRFYKLTRNRAPLAYLLQVEHNPRRPLLEKGTNKELRYCTNQKTPYREDQSGYATVGEIIFEEGFLTVNPDNSVLQHFLSVTPDNGREFVEIDHAKDAEAELEKIDLETEAILRAKEIGKDVDTLEAVARIIFSKDISRLTTSELKRDVRVFARNNPEKFLNMIEDKDLDIVAKVQAFFDRGMLSKRNNNRDVYYNMPDNKRKMLTVPQNSNPREAVVKYLTSNDGIEVLKMLEIHLENL